MKFPLIVFLSCCTITAFEQSYPFTKNFVSGVIILKDSTSMAGQLKWFPDQNEKLKFREHENADIHKYSPEDLIGFDVDTLKFYSLFNFDAYASDYALSGKTSKIKQCFGQLLDSGSFNIYLVFISGYDALCFGLHNISFD